MPALRRRTFLAIVFMGVLIGCAATISVSGSGATGTPPDPVLTCTTPTLTLKPGQQGTLHWEATVPAATTTTTAASGVATYSDATNVAVPANVGTTLVVSEPPATAFAFTWPMPATVTFVSGTVTRADATTVAVATPTTANVTAALGPIAAGQKASISITVQAKTG
jgi:hypothetical protein